MTQAVTLDFDGFFDGRENPRTPAAPISYTVARREERLTTRPLHASKVKPSTDLTAFIEGSRYLGMKPKAQQLLIAAVLEDEEKSLELGGVLVPRYEQVAVCVPRRAGKTSAIWPVLIGRCLTRPGYKVLTTAQTGVKARERFMEVARALDAHPYAPYRVLRGVGHEAIEFANGSRLWVAPPEQSAFRGDAADVMLFDESQEYSVSKTEELIGSAYPLLDTRPGAQVIIAGTAGKSREGMLWDALEDGRQGKTGCGIVEFAAADDADPTKAATWRKAHPGIGTLTTMSTIAKRFEKLPLLQFQREYLGQWPFDVSKRAIDSRLWERARIDTLPLERPEHLAIAFEISPDQTSAAVAAAWRDERGHAHVEIIEHKAGDRWIPKFIHQLAIEHKGVMFGYDHIGANAAAGDELARARAPRPRLKPLGMREMIAGCARLMSDIGAGRFHHYSQPGLDSAADEASRRPVGDSWLWNRRKGGDITPLVAATAALRVLDSTQARGRVRIVTAK